MQDFLALHESPALTAMQAPLPPYLRLVLIMASLYALVVIFMSIADRLPSDSPWVRAGYLCMFAVCVSVLFGRSEASASRP